ncbi:MAG: lamin tail domain-containing protein [Planctomycetes bacterium]|nr:lamin tail domain-containing protein [Planctomycetota bacterium]
MIHKLFALAVFIIILASAAGAQSLKIYIIDVGQGSSTLIVGPTGKSMLIDGGPDQSGWITSPSGPGPVAQTIAAAGISQLDYTLLTHYHSDHYEGITEIATHNYLKSTALAYDRGNTPAPENGFTAPINAYIAAVGAKRTTITPGVVVDLGGGATMTCKVVAGQIAGGPLVNTSGSSELENSNSIALLLDYKNFQMFIGGDLTGGGGSTTNVENPLAPYVGNVDVYLADHHGSSTSSAVTFINSIVPEVSIASCGLHNSYNHPSGTFLNNVNKSSHATMVYCTTGGADGSDGFGNRGFVNADGNIVLETDGNLYQITPIVGKPRLFVCDELNATYPGPGTSDLRISEYMPDPSAVPDNAGEWFEIQNVSGYRRNLNGLKISQSDGVTDLFTFATTILLNPGDTYVFCVSGDYQRNGGVVADMSWPYSTFFLDANDSILIKNPSNVSLESLTYTSAWPDGVGVAAQRINLLGATNTQSNWTAATATFGSGDKGTPGARNTADTTVLPAQFVSQGGLAVDTTWNVNFYSYNEPGDIYLGVLSQSTAQPWFVLEAQTFPVLADSLLFDSLAFPGFLWFLDGNGFGSTGVAVPNDNALHGYSFYGVVGVYDYPTIQPGKVSAVVSLTIP